MEITNLGNGTDFVLKGYNKMTEITNEMWEKAINKVHTNVLALGSKNRTDDEQELFLRWCELSRTYRERGRSTELYNAIMELK